MTTIRGITFKQLIAINTILFIAFLTISTKFLYDKDYELLDNQIVEMIKNIQKELKYNINKLADNQEMEILTAYFDKKMIANNLINAISLGKDGVILVSTDKKLINQPFNKMYNKEISVKELAHLKEFYSDVQIIQNDKKEQFTLILGLNTQHFELLHDELLLSTVTHSLIVGVGFFILQALIFYFFLYKPLINILKSIKNNDIQNRVCYLEEFTELNDEFVNYSNKLNQLNSTLEEKVREEVERRVKNEKILIEQSQFLNSKNLITNISHHWRQPLNLISIILESIKENLYEDVVDREKIKLKLDDIRDTVFELSETINKFAIQNKNAETSKIFNLKHTIENIYFLFNEHLKFYDIEFNLHIDKDYTIKAKEIYIRNTIISIIDNAKEAILLKQEKFDFQPFINLTVSEGSGFVIIDIENNGVLINEDDSGKVFEPYFSTKFHAKGVGLNLFLAKLSIERELGGFLSLYKIAPTTVFRIEIPIQNPAVTV